MNGKTIQQMKKNNGINNSVDIGSPLNKGIKGMENNCDNGSVNKCRIIHFRSPLNKGTKGPKNNIVHEKPIGVFLITPASFMRFTTILNPPLNGIYSKQYPTAKRLHLRPSVCVTQRPRSTPLSILRNFEQCSAPLYRCRKLQRLNPPCPGS